MQRSTAQLRSVPLYPTHTQQTVQLGASVSSHASLRVCKQLGWVRHGSGGHHSQICSHLRSRTICQARQPQPQESLVDMRLMAGDVVMLLVTQLASSRILREQEGILSSVLVLAWIAVAFTKGDYRGPSEMSVHFGSQVALLMANAMQKCAITWVVFVPIVLAVYATLVSQDLLHPAAFRADLDSLPAEVEIILACLLTVATWRATYAVLRLWL